MIPVHEVKLIAPVIDQDKCRNHIIFPTSLKGIVFQKHILINVISMYESIEQYCPESMRTLLRSGIKAVKAASRVTAYSQQLLIGDAQLVKEDVSPVTIADYASQVVVSLVLRKELGFPISGNQNPVSEKERAVTLERLGTFRMLAEEDSTDLESPEKAIFLSMVLNTLNKNFSRKEFMKGTTENSDVIPSELDENEAKNAIDSTSNWTAKDVIEAISTGSFNYYRDSSDRAFGATGRSQISKDEDGNLTFNGGRVYNSVEEVPSYFCLDPIDGTKGFIRRQQYAVGLSFVEKGETVLSFIACPNVPFPYSTSPHFTWDSISNWIKSQESDKKEAPFSSIPLEFPKENKDNPIEVVSQDLATLAGLDGVPLYARATTRFMPSEVAESPNASPSTVTEATNKGILVRGTIFVAIKGIGAFMLPLFTGSDALKMLLDSAADQYVASLAETSVQGAKSPMAGQKRPVPDGAQGEIAKRELFKQADIQHWCKEEDSRAASHGPIGSIILRMDETTGESKNQYLKEGFDLSKCKEAKSETSTTISNSLPFHKFRYCGSHQATKHSNMTRYDD